jgi:hypothetical protein
MNQSNDDMLSSIMEHISDIYEKVTDIEVCVEQLKNQVNNLENSIEEINNQSVSRSSLRTIDDDKLHQIEEDDQPNNSCNVNESRVKKHCRVVKKIKRKMESLVPIPVEDNYDTGDIKCMTDYALAAEWIRITGHEELYCSHCKKSKPIVPSWINSIRNRCEKKGLYANIDVPKTCDQQQTVNKLCNPVNNLVYYSIRNKKLTDEETEAVIKLREKHLKKIGVEIKPYKYQL